MAEIEGQREGKRSQLTIISGTLRPDIVSLRARARYTQALLTTIEAANVLVPQVDFEAVHDAKLTGGISGIEELEENMSFFPLHRVRGGLGNIEDDPEQSS